MKSVLVLFASMTFAISPFLSPEFGGFDPERYPIPQEDPPVQPAGWAFAIWGIIYLGLIIHASMGLIRYKNNAAWERGRVALFISLAVGTVWLPIALMSPLWATALIWVMLISSLIALYQMRTATPAWVATWPVALYAGWLSAASFVSIGLLLAGYGLLSEVSSAVICLAGATLFAMINQIRLAEWPYAAAVAWGFAGIAVANFGEEHAIAYLSILAAGIMMTTAVVQSLSASFAR
ncbi:MAG: tryptophan-rich sensory protein [Granulosicoccus sp.]|nr:tryptophan-rich sensory protein [Granulosicoccus sp.]